MGPRPTTCAGSGPSTITPAEADHPVVSVRCRHAITAMAEAVAAIATVRATGCGCAMRGYRFPMRFIRSSYSSEVMSPRA